MPPVLDISFAELTSRRSQDVRAGFAWRTVDQCHHILKLIPEPICTTGLIIAGARPDPASQYLVRQPTVHHEVQTDIRSRDLHCIQDVFPARRYGSESLAR